MVNDRVLNASRQVLQARQSENAARVYTVNWASELDTDTISTSTWSCEDSNVTIASDSNTTTTAYATISGSIGEYRIVNKIVTAAGETDERYIDLKIMDNTKYYASTQYYDYRW